MIKKMLAVIAVLFLLPAGVAVALHVVSDRPMSWRSADWSSSGILPSADKVPGAAVHVLFARTGGLKGALAAHSWIVYKRAGDSQWTRYDKVGWGSPVRRNGYPADGRWYSNTPMILTSLAGGDAEAVIPEIEKAIAAYPYANRGDYRIWPGPNSNTFVAHVLAATPGLGAVLPPEAVGKDYRPLSEALRMENGGLGFDLTLGGYAGLAVGLNSGLELRFMGLVTGIDTSPALKIPGFGRVGIP